MERLGDFERWISTHAKQTLAVLSVITILMMYLATFSSSGFDTGGFNPETEEGRAAQTISEEYGAEGVISTILFVDEENVLSRESLHAMIDLEEAVIASPHIDGLVGTPEMPSGIMSVAEIVIQSAFFTTAIDTFQATGMNGTNTTGGNGNSTGSSGNVSALYRSFFERMVKLTIEEKRTILDGGVITLTLDGVPFPIDLTFLPYEPTHLPHHFNGTPFEMILPYVLSDDFNGTSATKALFSMNVDPELEAEGQFELEKGIDELAQNATEGREELQALSLGGEFLNDQISVALGRNIGTLMPLAFGLTILVLAVVFKNRSDLGVSLLTLLLVLIWLYGIGGLFQLLGIFGPLGPQTITVPILIITLGIDYGIHLTLRYREELQKGLGITEALAESGSTVGFAILITTVTTVVGFLSNLLSDIRSIREFGILLAVGIVISFVLWVTFFPAIKTVFDTRRLKKGKPLFKELRTEDRGWGKAWASVKDIEERPELVCATGVACLNRGIGLGALAARKPLIVFALVGFFAIMGIFGAVQLEPRFSNTDFLPTDVDGAEGLNILFDEFEFSSEGVTILVEGDVADPDVFRAMETVAGEGQLSPDAVLSERVESPYHLGVEFSEPTNARYVAAIAAVWDTRIDRDGDGVVDAETTREDVLAAYDAFYMYDYDMSRRVLHRDNVTGEYDGAAIRLPVNTQQGERVVQITDSYNDASVALEDMEGGVLDLVVVTGGPVLTAGTFTSITQGGNQSIVVTFALVVIILGILYYRLYRSPGLGVIALAPLVFVIIWTQGAMYFLGIPLNVVTVTISAITIGLGVDYSIHLVQRFQEDLNKVGDSECALCVSVNHTGTALFGSALTTIMGFFVLSFALIPPLAQFGAVTSLSIILAFAGAVFVLPTLLLLWYKWGVRTGRVPSPADSLGERITCTLPSDLSPQGSSEKKEEGGDSHPEGEGTSKGSEGVNKGVSKGTDDPIDGT